MKCHKSSKNIFEHFRNFQFQKKGQVSLFVIIGIVLIVLVAGGLMFFNNNKTQELKEENSNSLDLASNAKSVSEYINLCLKESSLNSIEKFGLIDSKEYLETDVAKKFEECVSNLENFENIFDIKKSNPEVEVELSEDMVVFSLRYPVKLNKEDSEFKLEEFMYNYNTESFERINNGDIKKGTQIVSTDLKAKLNFKENTNAYDFNGNPVEKISLKVIDNNFDGLKNSVVVGSVVYNALPDGTYFENPVELSISVLDNDIRGINPDRLQLAYYDEEMGFWIAVPGSKYDIKSKSVIGNINHFSYYSVAICAGNTNGRYVIPMEFVANDPFWELDGVSDPRNWNYNVDETLSLDINSIHILPEFMTSKIETKENAETLFTEDTPKDKLELDVKDWDMDDQKGVDDVESYVFKEPVFKDDSGNDITCSKTEAMSACTKITSPEIWAKYASSELKVEEDKKNCLQSCSDFAKEELETKYSEWDVASNHNNDGIRDLAEINCVFKVVDPADVAKLKIECNKYLYNIDSELEKHFPNAEYSHEWINVDENEQLTSVFQEEGSRKFFATPNTLGMTVSSDSFPVNFIEGKAQLWDSSLSVEMSTPYTTKGEFLFNIKDGGGACISPITTTPDFDTGVYARIVTRKIDYTTYYECANDNDYERQCADSKPGDEWKLVNTRLCEENECYEKEREDARARRLEGSEYAFDLASKSGEGIDSPLILPKLTTTRTARFLPKKSDSLNMELMDYLKLVEVESLEKLYDWSCSDMCIWEMNKGENSGKLIDGENKVSVDVLNVKDSALYAQAYLEIIGNGVMGLDECGAKVQDRINYLCGCSDATCSGVRSDRDNELLQCLASIREELDTFESGDPDNSAFGSNAELCDVNSIIKTLTDKNPDNALSGCRYNNPAETSRYGELKASIISEITEHGFGNGGICIAGEKYCRDELDSVTDKDCICGIGDTVSTYDGTPNMFCCKDTGQIVDEAEFSAGNCRGSTIRDSCEVDFDADGTVDEILFSNTYKFLGDKCWHCDSTGTTQQITDLLEIEKNCLEVEVYDVCEFPTLYGDILYLEPTESTCYARIDSGKVTVEVASCASSSDGSGKGIGTSLYCADLTWSTCKMNSENTFECCEESDCVDVVQPIPPNSCQAYDAAEASKLLSNYEFARVKIITSTSPLTYSDVGCYLCKEGSLSLQDDIKCSSEYGGGTGESNICEEQEVLGITYFTEEPSCQFIPSLGQILYGSCKTVSGSVKTYAEVCCDSCTSSEVTQYCDESSGCKSVEPNYGNQCGDSSGTAIGYRCDVTEAYCCQAPDNNYYCTATPCVSPIEGYALPTCPTDVNVVASFNRISGTKKCYCSETSSTLTYLSGQQYKVDYCYTPNLDCTHEGASVLNGKYHLDITGTNQGVYGCSDSQMLKYYKYSDICFEWSFISTDISNVKQKGDYSSPGNYICNGNNIWVTTCSNTIKDGYETDVNCGGVDCNQCVNGNECNVDADCQSNLCESNICSDPSTTRRTIGLGE